MKASKVSNVQHRKEQAEIHDQVAPRLSVRAKCEALSIPLTGGASQKPLAKCCQDLDAPDLYARVLLNDAGREALNVSHYEAADTMIHAELYLEDRQAYIASRSGVLAFHWSEVQAFAHGVLAHHEGRVS